MACGRTARIQKHVHRRAHGTRGITSDPSWSESQVRRGWKGDEAQEHHSGEMSPVKFHVFNFLTPRRSLKVKMSPMGRKLGPLDTLFLLLGLCGGLGESLNSLPAFTLTCLPASAQHAPSRCRLFLFPLPHLSEKVTPRS